MSKTMPDNTAIDNKITNALHGVFDGSDLEDTPENGVKALITSEQIALLERLRTADNVADSEIKRLVDIQDAILAELNTLRGGK